MTKTQKQNVRRMQRVARQLRQEGLKYRQREAYLGSVSGFIEFSPAEYEALWMAARAAHEPQH
jgi:hypothetical protein